MFIIARTELEAINTILSMVGESPVNSTGVDDIAPGALAKSILRETSRRIQSSGWYFNTEENYTLTPDISGYIYVPINTMALRRPVTSRGEVPLIVRNNHLYDTRNHTDKFTQSVQVDLILALDFNDLPQAAREYITLEAAAVYCTRYMQDQTLLQFAQIELQRAKDNFLAEDYAATPQRFWENGGAFQWTRYRSFQ